MKQAEWFDQIRDFFEEKIAFDKHLGIRLEEIECGRALLRLPFRPEFVGDPFRPALHGGIIATMVDVAAGVASLSTLPYGSLCSTVDMRVDYLLPGQPQDLLAEAVVVRSGNRVAVVNVDIRQDEAHIASGRAVYNLKPASAP